MSQGVLSLTLLPESPPGKTPRTHASVANCVQADSINAVFLAMGHGGALLLARDWPPLQMT